MPKQEFYVGWMEKAPVTVARFVKKYLLFLLGVVVSLGALLAMNQKRFSKANFEFGKPTVVKGIYVSSPVPHLLVADKNDYVMIPLVGYGKHGAQGVMSDLQVEKGIAFNGKLITLKGSLLYGDGKILMQVDKNDDPLVAISAMANQLPVFEADKGQVSLSGEVIDPKCYFGVMKPGEGKVHKDCAIRCILGGIPPVLKMTSENGQISYVLLTGDNINERVKDFVAVPSQVTGHLKKYNDWEILNVSLIGNVGNSSAVKTLSSATCKTKNCCKKM